MHGARRQQRRDRDAVGARRAVRQDDDVVVLRAHGLLGLGADDVERPAHAGAALVGGVGDVDGDRREVVILHLPDLTDALEILVGQDRLVDLEPLDLRGAFEIEEVRTRADERHEAHDELLADRVDRRVRHLREVLLEVGVQQLRLRRQRRDRRVRAHGADGLLAGLHHRAHEELQAFLRVAERLLQIDQGDVRLVLGHLLRQRQVADLDLRLLQPLLVRIARGQIGLQLVVRDDAALREIDQQHLAGLQAPLARDALLGDRQHARLRRHDDDVVLGDEIARRPQAVAVERGADLAAVGEGHGGGAVPRLHQAGVVLVEGLALAIHRLMAGPGLRDQHHRGVRQRIAAHDQEFERVVEAGRVRLALVADRPELRDLVAVQRRGHRRLPGRHPVDVAAQRVDLAVVRDHAIGVRELPRRERVGREALVDQRHGRGKARIGEILVVGLDLERQEHALVDERPARQRHGVVTDVAPLVGIVDGVRDDLADHVELALELVLVGDGLRPADEDLPMHRLGVAHHVGQRRIVDRHGAIAEELEAFLADEARPDPLAMLAQPLVLRHEQMADGIVASLRQLDLERLALVLQELVRDLNENARAVARERVGADGAAMLEVLEDGERVGDELVRRPPLEIGDEADAAGVVLAFAVEESGGGGMRIRTASDGLQRSLTGSLRGHCFDLEFRSCHGGFEGPQVATGDSNATGPAARRPGRSLL